MRLAVLALVSLITGARAFAAYQVGDTVADMCWQDWADRTICLNDTSSTVRVLLYSAGYCGPCNQEMHDLVPRLHEVDGQPVTFISVSAYGWQGNSKPDAPFLQEWQAKYDIPFIVVGKFRDGGIKFGQSAIPNVAILDSQGKLVYKALNPGVDKILSEVKQVLQQH